MTGGKLLKGWLALAAAVLAGGVLAQAPGGDAARARTLLEGARKEGEVVLYTSMAEKDSARLVSAFEKKYGLKVKVWRSGKNKVLQRVVAEARANRFEADVILNPSPEMEALHQEKLLQPVNSPVHAGLVPAALPEHREWAGMRVYVFVQSYNTQKVKPAELPRTYQDLLDPRWKGRLGIEVKQQEWFYALVQAMGEDKGLAYFRELVAATEPSLRTGMSLLNNMVVSGEVPLAVNVYSYLPEQAKANGAPVNYVSLSPAVAYTDGIGIARQAPHPNAAALFYDFMLSDGQQIVQDNKAITTSVRDAARLAKLNPIYIDPAKVLESYDKWGRMYDEVLNGRSVSR